MNNHFWLKFHATFYSKCWIVTKITRKSVRITKKKLFLQIFEFIINSKMKNWSFYNLC